MARLSRDVSTGLTWHAVLDSQAIGERVTACDHTEAMPTDAPVLFDRGYPSYFLCNWLRLQRRDFCMHVPKDFHLTADALLRNRQSHRRITLTANAAARAQCQEAQVSAEPLSLRLVRVEFPDGEVEILATSVLEETACSDADFGPLYHLRWGIEGDFRVQKSRLQVENLSGRQPAAIRQDVHAAVLTKNLAQALALRVQARSDADAGWQLPAAITASAQRTAGRTHTRKLRPRIDFTSALHHCKFTLVKALIERATDALLIHSFTRYRWCERPNVTVRRPASGAGGW